MSHHSSSDDDGTLSELMKNFEGVSYADARKSFGATGMFPRGKLIPSDEGEVQFGVTHKDNKVVLDFGTPVVWVGMSPAEATDLASILKKHALLARK